MIQPVELQRLLREFGGGLAGVEVTPVAESLAPHLVRIVGTCWIRGNPLTFEVEDFDLRRIKDVDDVLGLARQFLESFAQAEKHPAGPPPTH